MSSIAYFIREAFKGFARNLSTALGSIVTIFLSLLIIGVFLVGGVVVDNIVDSVESKVSITCYIADDAEDADIQTVENFINGLDGVASVSFTSKDQALENFKNSMTSNPEIIEQLDGQNPLPASIDVELSEAQEVQAIADQIEANETFRAICDNPDDPSDSLKYGQKTVEKLFALTNYIRYIGIALIALLVFIAFVFINNTIRLSILARSKEISIMRLVGASNNFIRGPFSMEGALHALIGAGFAIACLQLLRMFALPRVQDALPWLPINVGSHTYLLIYLGLLVAGLIIGLIGSALAMRRYLKV
ncbi:MAG: permease-like cell division protein FtsX [Eggerthellaceae bacterium]|nr:permease-like cell division protein FtsX [Eggerthellaceae bacterium]